MKQKQRSGIIAMKNGAQIEFVVASALLRRSSVCPFGPWAINHRMRRGAHAQQRSEAASCLPETFDRMCKPLCQSLKYADLVFVSTTPADRKRGEK